MEAVLVADGLVKRYFRKSRESARDFDAVSGVSLSLNPGMLVMVKGRSGSGKSTLLNMLAGLLAPTEGAVRFEGDDLYALEDDALSRLRNRKFGVIPQGQTPLHSLTVVQNVKLPSLLYGLVDEPTADSRAMDLLSMVGIAHLAEAYPSELSGGELHRMAIARAFVNEPAVIFADEPTGDLDDENTETVLTQLRGAADRGAAVLLVTHEPTAERYADQVLSMNSGILEEICQ